MIEKIGHIRNPLTVIAIFAALAEVSGTIVLPFLDRGMQQVYVWFLMLFPVVLVLAFFLTLNFNRRALYAPSDFREEKHFLELATAATPEAREEKLTEEVAHLRRMEERQPKIGLPPIPMHIPSEVAAASKSADESRRSKVSLSETLVLQLVSWELRLPITAGIKLTGRYPSQSILFDGVIEKGQNITAVEVKYYPTRKFATSDVKEFFSRVERLQMDINDLQEKALSLIFVVVTDEDAEGQERIRIRLSATASRFTMPIEIRVYAADSLIEAVEKSLRVKIGT